MSGSLAERHYSPLLIKYIFSSIRDHNIYSHVIENILYFIFYCAVRQKYFLYFKVFSLKTAKKRGFKMRL